MFQPPGEIQTEQLMEHDGTIWKSLKTNCWNIGINCFSWDYHNSQLGLYNSQLLVGGLPTPLKIWVRQLGLWHSQYMEKLKPCSKPPTRLGLSSQILSWKSNKWLKPATHEETSKPHSPVKHLKAVNMEAGMFLCNVRALGNASTDLWKSMLGTFNYALRKPFPKANLGLHNVSRLIWVYASAESNKRSLGWA